MAGGRRKEPIDLLLLKGKAKPQKSVIEKRKNEEVKNHSDLIEPPAHFTDQQIEKFNWYVREMERVGIIANMDVDALARYVEVQGLYQTLMDRLSKLDVLDEEFGKLLRQQDIAFKQARSLSNDLGFTLSSRLKLTVPKTEDKEPTKEEKRFGGAL